MLTDTGKLTGFQKLAVCRGFPFQEETGGAGNKHVLLVHGLVSHGKLFYLGSCPL